MQQMERRNRLDIASFPGLPAKRSLYAASSLRMQTVMRVAETSREVDVGVDV